MNWTKTVEPAVIPTLDINQKQRVTLTAVPPRASRPASTVRLRPAASRTTDPSREDETVTIEIEEHANVFGTILLVLAILGVVTGSSLRHPDLKNIIHPLKTRRTPWKTDPSSKQRSSPAVRRRRAGPHGVSFAVRRRNLRDARRERRRKDDAINLFLNFSNPPAARRGSTASPRTEPLEAKKRVAYVSENVMLSPNFTPAEPRLLRAARQKDSCAPRRLRATLAVSVPRKTYTEKLRASRRRCGRSAASPSPS